jgi:CRP-like cAMP-binding protein
MPARKRPPGSPPDASVGAEDLIIEESAASPAPIAAAASAAAASAAAVGAVGDDQPPLWAEGLRQRARGDHLAELRCFAALLRQDPRDRLAWHEVGAALLALGETARGTEALASLGQAHAEVGHLPLAILVAKELETVDRPASRRLVERLGTLYGVGSTRLAQNQRLMPPALPRGGDAAAPGTAPSSSGPGEGAPRAEVVAAAEQAVDQAVEQVRAENALPVYPLFDVLTPDLVAELISVLRRREVPSGTLILEEGAAADGVYFVARGEVVVTRRGTVSTVLGDGPACAIEPPVELARLHPGAFFGEMALVARTPRGASVRALEPTTLLELATEHVDRLGLASPAFAQALAGFCRARLLANLMTTSPLFEKLPPEGRGAVIERFRPHIYQPDQVVLSEGQTPDRAALFVVASGSLEVEKADAGETIQLARLGPGEVFGEISLIRRSIVTATVRAVTRSVVLELSRDDFDEVGQAYPQLLAHVYQLATLRERDLAEVLAGQVFSADDLLI